MLGNLLKLSFLMAGVFVPLLAWTVYADVEDTTPTLGDIAPITAYQSVRESGDMLVIAPYTIAVTGTLPEELASDEYQVIFRQGANYLQLVHPVSTSENGLKGYHEGFSAFYFSATQVSDLSIIFNSPGTYTVELDAVTGTPNTTSTDIEYRSGGVEALESDLAILAQVLESQWDLDIINSGRLTATGQDYFAAVIPFLEQMVPGFVFIQTTRADPSKTTHGTTGSDAAADFWSGTSADTAFSTLGSQWGLSSMEVRTAITLLVAIGVAIFMLMRGAPAWSTLMAGGVIVGLAPSVGMAPVALALFTGFVGFFVGTFAWWLARG